MAQDDPKTAQDRPKMAQDGDKMAQDSPKTSPNGPKKAPRYAYLLCYSLATCVFWIRLWVDPGLPWPTYLLLLGSVDGMASSGAYYFADARAHALLGHTRGRACEFRSDFRLFCVQILLGGTSVGRL